MSLPYVLPSDAQSYFVEGRWEELFEEMMSQTPNLGRNGNFLYNYLHLGLRFLYRQHLDPEGKFLVFIIKKGGTRGNMCDAMRYCTRHRLPEPLEVALRLGGRFQIRDGHRWLGPTAGEGVFETCPSNLEDAVRCLEILRHYEERLKLEATTLEKILNREWVPLDTPEELVQRMCVLLFPENPEVRILMKYNPKHVSWYRRPKTSVAEDFKIFTGIVPGKIKQE